MAGIASRIGQRGAVGSNILKPLRVASVLNRFHDYSTGLGGSRDIEVHYWPHWLARDMTSLCISFDAWYSNASSENAAGAPYTVLDAAIVTPNGKTTAAPFGSGASRSKLINNGDAAVLTDEVPASAMGYGSVVPAGSLVYIKFRTQAATPGGTMLVGGRRTGGYGGNGSAQVASYDSTATVASTTDAAGQYTVASGTAFVGSDKGVEAILLGRPVVDGVSVLGAGDSVLAGTADTANAVWGNGYLQRSLMNAALTAPMYNGINFSTPSAVYQVPALSSRWRAYIPYCTVGYDEMGINNLKTTAIATVKGYGETVWTAFRGGGIRTIIHPKFLPETSSSNNWVDNAGQTYNSTVGAPGSLNSQMNDYYDQKIADGTIQYAPYFPTLRDPTDPFKWVTNGTANYATVDGLHESTAGHTLIAAEVRNLWAGIEKWAQYA